MLEEFQVKSREDCFCGGRQWGGGVEGTWFSISFIAMGMNGKLFYYSREVSHFFCLRKGTTLTPPQKHCRDIPNKMSTYSTHLTYTDR